MGIKVYISGVCGSQEVRKRQRRVQFVLTSMKIDYETIDVTEPGRDNDREFMQEQCKKHDKENVLPPQIFNDTEYCGDYSDFEVANDDDRLLVFLKLQQESAVNEITVNGNKEDEVEEKEETTGEKNDIDIFSNETVEDSRVEEIEKKTEVENESKSDQEEGSEEEED